VARLSCPGFPKVLCQRCHTFWHRRLPSWCRNGGHFLLYRLMHCHEFKKIPITAVAITVCGLSKWVLSTKYCQKNSDTEKVCITFHLHCPDHVTWIHAVKRPRVSTSRDLQCLVILAPVCPQCHCQSVADYTDDVTIGQFASRLSEVSCQIPGEIIGCISGNWIWFRWGLKWIITTVGVMWGSWW